MRKCVTLLTVVCLMSVFTACESSRQHMQDQLVRIVSKIQRADYEGNQTAMQQAYDQLTPFLEDAELVSRVRYWRGFAMWRKAVNGFNDNVDPKELEQDLKQALDEFKQAISKDPGFVDAKIGTISCVGYLAFMNREDQPRAKEFVGQILPVVKEVKDVAPDNPRFLWVLGPILWNTPPERGGGQEKAIENYEHGLALFEKNKSAAANALEPSWGRPELMMNLAYSHLNKSTPDIDAAELYAQSALGEVPNWHYVRDILLPQILAAKAKATEN
jgi:tetratricopeptide (TPR) repeat protein